MRARIRRERRTYAGYSTRCLVVDGTGPPFLLLHGYTDSADAWRLLLLELARRGRAAVAIDMPSHGHADSVSSDRPGLEQLVDCAAAAADDLGPGTIVVGNSLGGTVALLVAERQGSLGAVVPIGPAAFAHPIWLRFSLQPVSNAIMRITPRILQLPPYLATAFAAKMAPSAIPTYLSHVLRATNHKRLRTLADGLATEAVDPYNLSRITAPVTLVWGTRDRMALNSGAKILLTAIPDARYIPLRGVGHTPQQQAPARVADILCDLRARTHLSVLAPPAPTNPTDRPADPGPLHGTDNP
ncbi:alpha/beta fold hydrolase [Antrihabitans stalactiti]|uniref:Alpha/beta hydrolase n=1 Tax=Antrihabitans stalactiti TaxID=2584121 RepID=A0A848KG94_9NOCA|nr:alpha/beta hydrolase [Antrihabitans stalactiti]NMN96708.1 alpha/beta hydrolase [Antrihabitans stalactiti]